MAIKYKYEERIPKYYYSLLVGNAITVVGLCHFNVKVIYCT